MAKTSISKMDAVRKALAELGNDAMPGKIQEFVKEKFGVAMTLAHVSNYKSKFMKMMPKAAAPALAPVKAVSKPSNGSAISLKDIEIVKSLVGRVGEGNLKSLIELLG